MKKLLLSALTLFIGLTASATVPVGGAQILQKTSSNPYAIGETAVYNVDRDEAWFKENFTAEQLTEAWGMGVWLDKGYVVYEDEMITITAAVDATPVYFKGNKNEQIQADGHNGYFNMGSTMPDQVLSGEETITDLSLDGLKKSYMGVLKVVAKAKGTLGAKIYAGDSKRCFGIYKLATEAEMDNDDFGGWAAYVNFRNGDPAKDENLECSYHKEHHELNAPEYITCEIEAGREYLIIAGGQKNLNLSEITYAPAEMPAPAGVQIMQRNGKEITVDRDEAWFTENFTAEQLTEAWGMGVWLDKNYVVYKDEELTITAAVDDTPVYFKGNKNEQIQADGHNGYFNMGSTMPDQVLTGEETITDLSLDGLKKSYMGVLRVVPNVDGVLGAKIYAGDSKRCFGIYKLATEAEMDNDDFGGWAAYVNFRNGDPAKDENLECSYHKEHHELNAPEYITCDVVAGRDYLIIAGGQKNLNLSMITFEASSTGIEGINTENGMKAVKAIYSINGTQVNGLQKGINIVKYSDGTSKKIIK
ncbi:MAG: hypothetical protein ACI4BA_07265 [Prevotella sp.]